MFVFAGDAHGDFVPLIEEAGEASAVALLGDQEPMNDLDGNLGLTMCACCARPLVRFRPTGNWRQGLSAS